MPTVGRYSLPRCAVADEAWTVFGVFTVSAFLLGAAYCGWRAFSPPVETSLPVIVEAAAQASPAFANRTVYHPSLPVADQPVSWQDLTLMLRTGLTDEDIIAALQGKQLVSTIGPAQVNLLRELGAGMKLLDYLRTRPLYVAALTAPRVAVNTSVRPRVNGVVGAVGGTVRQSSTPAPVDYTARDRQIKSLQAQIDQIDAQILQVRNHSGSYSLLGAYNGRGSSQGDESPLKKYLDQLDKQRNDLRRQKWTLEGR